MKPININLGNWLLSPKGIPFKVSSIDFDEVYSKPKEYIVDGYQLHKCAGIKIDEDVLLRFGFSYKGDSNMFEIFPYKNKLEMVITVYLKSTKENKDVFVRNLISVSQHDDRENKEIVNNDWNHVDLPIEMNYVHELQNLFYTITGNELKLK